MGSGPSAELGGVRVFKVSPGSPAAEAGLEVFFDFIIEVNGAKLDPSCQQVFAEKIQESENKHAKLTVYNTRAHSTREVVVMPRKWAGNGLLGATVRYDVVDPAENHGIRVLEVFPNSPAAHAGLVPFQDYLLGTAQAVFHDIDELVEAVTTHINQRIQVYVYNADSESVREVVLVPNNDWGGDGCIGCDIGTGLLHRIPAPRRAPGSSPAAGQAPAHAGAWAPPQAPAHPGAWPQVQGFPAGIPTPSYPPGAITQGLPPPTYPPGVVPGMVPGAPQGLPTPAYPPAGMPQGLGVPPPTYMPGVPPQAAHQGMQHPANPWGHLPQVQQAASALPGVPPMPALGAVGGGAPTAPAGGPGLGPAHGTGPMVDMSMVGHAPPPTLPGGALSPTSMLESSMSQSELPRAPPGTPMNISEVPPAPDLSSMLEPKLAAMSSVAAGGPALGAELYQQVSGNAGGGAPLI